MKYRKWIGIGAILLVVLLVGTVFCINQWYNSGNVRAMDGRLRVKLSGVAYMFDYETGEMLGQTIVFADGQTNKSNKEVFDGELNMADYMNEADGTVTTYQTAIEGNNGYWEILVDETCLHYEETEDGGQKEVNHSCKYSYSYYVHPDKQDFLIVRVADKYDVYPIYVVMAGSEAEAAQIYKEFLASLK